jgi:hypothetical protein
MYCNVSSSVWRTCCILVVELTSLPELKLLRFIKSKSEMLPVPVATQSKVWVCGHPLAELVGANPTGGINVYFV